MDNFFSKLNEFTYSYKNYSGKPSKGVKLKEIHLTRDDGIVFTTNQHASYNCSCSFSKKKHVPNEDGIGCACDKSNRVRTDVASNFRIDGKKFKISESPCYDAGWWLRNHEPKVIV